MPEEKLLAKVGNLYLQKTLNLALIHPSISDMIDFAFAIEK